MSFTTRSKCAVAGVGLFLALAVPPSVVDANAAPNGHAGDVEVGNLSVDGRRIRNCGTTQHTEPNRRSSKCPVGA